MGELIKWIKKICAKPSFSKSKNESPKEYESPLRYMMHTAHKIDYFPIPDYASAKESENGCVIIEGDYGGQIYLTCPMKQVLCSHETLAQLSKDIDAMFWDDDDGRGIFYEDIPTGGGVAGGMGGGVVTSGLWIHPKLRDAGLFDRILAVITGKQERI